MASLKDAMKEAMKHRNITKYTKGKMSGELEKEKERRKREKTLGRGSESASRDAWASLDGY